MLKSKYKIAIIFSIIFVLLATFTVLTACGEKDKKENNKQVAVKSETVDEESPAEETTADQTVADEPDTTKDAAEKEDKAKASAKADKPASVAPAKDKPSSDKDKSPKKSNDKKPEPAPKPPKNDTQPKPDEPKNITVTLSVDCKLLYDDDPDLAALYSTNGIMLSNKSVSVKKGATVLDVLKASGVNYVGTNYVSSIMGLHEKDGGSKSGWCYSVNGKFPSVGVSKYTVNDGDKIAFRYSLNNGLEFGV